MASAYSWGHLALAFVAVVVIRAFFRRYWAPIKDIPGPFLASFSNLWLVLQILKGHTEAEIIDLHKKHGELAQTPINCGHIEVHILIIFECKGILFASRQTKLVYLIQMPFANFFMLQLLRYDVIGGSCLPNMYVWAWH